MLLNGIYCGKKQSNHTHRAFEQFEILLSKIDKEEVNVTEFGVYHGKWIENMLCSAERQGKKLNVKGFDTFEGFPDTVTIKDTRMDNEKEMRMLRHRIKNWECSTTDEIVTRCKQYKSLKSLKLIKGNVFNYCKKESADIIHFDMDTYEVCKYVLTLINNYRFLVFDDYDHKFWRGVNKAVNEAEIKVTNLSEYLGLSSGIRTKLIYLTENVNG